MELQVGMLVRSLVGRDKGTLFLIARLTETTVFLVNGKGRTPRAPKQKNRKHVAFVCDCDSRASQHLREEARVTNSEIRKALSAYEQDDGQLPIKT